jgi:CheY-like chemotaxis protein
VLDGREPPRYIRLAEDELLVRFCIAQASRDAGYVVAEAQDALEALSILESKRIDLLITDIRMPGPLDRLELAKRTRELCPQTHVVLLSGNITRETESFDGLFSKPVRMSNLIAEVKKLLAEVADS